GLGLLASALFRRLLIGATRLHLAKDAFALQFLLERPKRLVDIVVSYDNLQGVSLFMRYGFARHVLDMMDMERERSGVPAKGALSLMMRRNRAAIGCG